MRLTLHRSKRASPLLLLTHESERDHHRSAEIKLKLSRGGGGGVASLPPSYTFGKRHFSSGADWQRRLNDVS